MLRRVFTPLHPDGFKFVLAGGLATLLLCLFWAPGAWLAAIATLWIAFFFRDPWRVTPTRPGLLVSPADGMVLSVAPATPPHGLIVSGTAVFRIGVFLNIFDVHVTRAPIGGRVAAMHYIKGRFLNASLDKASEGPTRFGEPRARETSRRLPTPRIAARSITAASSRMFPGHG